ncbi:MAG: serine/threonine protein kinase, partial [Desulfamplus sp.]|nr:serine/threonine protein kinase [Desulfamplus sp.]
MEDFEGQSLDSLITANKLDITDFLELAIQMAEALSALHRQNVIHKSINPFNILWNPQIGKIKLTGFGLATSLRKETQRVSKILEGTLDYISPEQTGRINCQMDYRSDLYSLGATFYFMLIRTAPFVSSDPMELVHCHIAKTPSFPEKSPISEESPIPEILKQIILRLMEKNPKSRYQSAISLKNDLEICKKQWLTSKIISSFELGVADHFDRFEIPHKLYGR